MQEPGGEDGCNDAVNPGYAGPHATRVNIFRERLRNDIPARAKMASHTTTRQGRPEAAAAMCLLWRYCIPQLGKQMRSHFEYRTGNASNNPSQKRLVMS